MPRLLRVVRQEHLGPLITLRRLSDYRGVDLVAATLSARSACITSAEVHVSRSLAASRWFAIANFLRGLAGARTKWESKCELGGLRRSSATDSPGVEGLYPSLHLVVSIDGLAPEHDLRRTPSHLTIASSNTSPPTALPVHCTVTRPMLARPGYLGRFRRFWSDRPEAVQNLVQHLYATGGRSIAGTLAAGGPGETLFEELSTTTQFPKVHLPRMALDGFRNPLRSPAEVMPAPYRAPPFRPT